MKNKQGNEDQIFECPVWKCNALRHAVRNVLNKLWRLNKNLH